MPNSKFHANAMQRYKLYKSGKLWLTAVMSTTMTAGAVQLTQTQAHADTTTSNSDSNTATTSSATTSNETSASSSVNSISSTSSVSSVASSDVTTSNTSSSSVPVSFSADDKTKSLEAQLSQINRRLAKSNQNKTITNSKSTTMVNTTTKNSNQTESSTIAKSSNQTVTPAYDKYDKATNIDTESQYLKKPIKVSVDGKTKTIKTVKVVKTNGKMVTLDVNGQKITVNQNQAQLTPVNYTHGEINQKVNSMHNFNIKTKRTVKAYRSPVLTGKTQTIAANQLLQVDGMRVVNRQPSLALNNGLYIKADRRSLSIIPDKVLENPTSSNITPDTKTTSSNSNTSSSSSAIVTNNTSSSSSVSSSSSASVTSSSSVSSTSSDVGSTSVKSSTTMSSSVLNTNTGVNTTTSSVNASSNVSSINSVSSTNTSVASASDTSAVQFDSQSAAASVSASVALANSVAASSFAAVMANSNAVWQSAQSSQASSFALAQSTAIQSAIQNTQNSLASSYAQSNLAQQQSVAVQNSEALQSAIQSTTDSVKASMASSVATSVSSQNASQASAHQSALSTAITMTTNSLSSSYAQASSNQSLVDSANELRAISLAVDNTTLHLQASYADTLNSFNAQANHNLVSAINSVQASMDSSFAVTSQATATNNTQVLDSFKASASQTTSALTSSYDAKTMSLASDYAVQSQAQAKHLSDISADYDNRIDNLNQQHQMQTDSLNQSLSAAQAALSSAQASAASVQASLANAHSATVDSLYSSAQSAEQSSAQSAAQSTANSAYASASTALQNQSQALSNQYQASLQALNDAKNDAVNSVTTSLANSYSQVLTNSQAANHQQLQDVYNSVTNSLNNDKAVAISSVQNSMNTSFAAVQSSLQASYAQQSNSMTQAQSAAVQSVMNSVAASMANANQNSLSSLNNSFTATLSSAVTSTAQSVATSYQSQIDELKSNHNFDTANTVTDATVDKARYMPGQTVNLNYTLSNAANTISKNDVKVTIYNQNQAVSTIDATQLVDGNSSQNFAVNWQSPNQDYTGYRAEISVDGQVQKVIAIDVSSDINKFPRYGAVTEFTPGTDNTALLNQMKNWNINSLEYYDAYQNPQNPINTDNPLGTWTQTWAPWLSSADKTKSGQVIKNTVDMAHQLGMDSMFYNMIYAITGNANDTNYLNSIGVKPDWLLYRKSNNQLFQFAMAGYINDHSSADYQNALQTYLDIKNPEVVNWIVDRMWPVLQYMDFDGWHGDTIGDNDVMYSKNADGSIKNQYRVSDELGTFANEVKNLLKTKKFVVNTVSYGGETNVATSNTDFDYSEQWDGNLYNLDQKIKQVASLSGKSLVIPAYLQSDYASANNGANKGKNFNENSVLLLDSVVNAAGGSRMEVVDGQHLLVGAFFPSKDLVVSDALKAQLQNYQTFLTAYENLLRDGQTDNYHGVNVYDNNGNNVRSDNAAANSVYAYGRSSNNSETIQLINMLGMSSNDWKDEDNSRQAPTTLNNFHVHYYPSDKYKPGGSNTATHIYLASPDGDKANQSVEVPFTWKQDQYGYYMDITVPSLQRWDMLYLK